MIQVLKQYPERILLSIFCAGLILLPLVYWPWADVRFEVPKVWFVVRWIELLGLVGYTISFWKPLRVSVDNKIPFVVLVLLIVAIVASIFGVDVMKSIWGNYYRFDGLFTFIHLIGLFFFLLTFWNDTWRRPMAVAVSLGLFLVSAFTIFIVGRVYFLQQFSSFLWGSATGVTFGQPNFLAGYIVVSLPFVWYVFQSAKKSFERYFMWLVLATSAVATVFTHSWGGLFGWIIFFALTRIHLNKAKDLFRLGIVLTVVTLMSIGIYIYFFSLQGFVPESRTRIFTKIVLGVSQRPLLGWGWANTDAAFATVDYPMYFSRDIYVDKAHATFLEILATTGIVGFSIYLIFLWILVRRLLYQRMTKSGKGALWTTMLFMVFVLYIFHSQTNIISIAEELYFWILVGIIGATTPRVTGR